MSTDPRQTPIPSTFKSAARNGDPYTPYTPLPGGVPAPQFPTGALPKTVETLVTEAAAAIGCPPDTIALSALTTLGSAIGNSRVIHMKKGWREGAAIYAAVIADSGEKKTAAIAVATDPAQKRQNELNKEYEKALDVFAREEREYEVEKKEAAKDGLAAPPPPKKPMAERVHVNDTTVEALIQLLKGSPRGVLQERDELVAFTKAMDQYKSGGKGADRQFYLSTYSNRPVSVDRKGQPEPLSVLCPFVAVIGSIQPSVLPELAEGREDGMLERFLCAYPEPINAMWTDDEISDAASASYHDLYTSLRKNLSVELDDLGDPIEKPLEFSHEAKELFVAQYNVHRTEMRIPGFPSNLRSPWAKLEGYFARLILILACCRIIENGDGERVEEGDVLKAWSLIQYFKDQARRVFGALRGFDPEARLVEDVARFLLDRGSEWTGQPEQFHSELSSGFKHERPDDLSKWLKKRSETHQEFGYDSRHKAAQKDDGTPTTVRQLTLTLSNGVNGVNGVNGENDRAATPRGVGA